jgi:hypothetical protein
MTLVKPICLKYVKYAIMAAAITLGLCLFAASKAHSADGPALGYYSFAGANTNNDGTATTADGFFIIDRHDGSGFNSSVFGHILLRDGNIALKKNYD